MNLHTAGNGLFGTHVTWEDIVEQIQKERKFNAFSGTIKKAELIGDGNGFVSRVALIEADFHGGADDLPSRFVVKMVTTLAGAEISEYVQERQDSDEAGLSDVYDAIVGEVLRAIAYLEAKSLEVSDEEKRKLATNPLPILYAPSSFLKTENFHSNVEQTRTFRIHDKKKL
ncbi:hypothetical protein NECAME_08788 [Necator americanus]|uniref:Uncharacterized protein n=1 Tax=Necator americanus TaxID=51031 RepID=W2THF6_NECAM|nr:hypothetical protein NECAME_08788 [Necator americanus]ETN81034.1 hypothetical protein NECAME_08788 [Necator americanus]